MSLCVLGMLATLAAPAAAQNPKHVLLLFDEDRSLPGLSALDQALRATLSAGLGDNIEFFTESMHVSQFPEEQHALALRDYYLKTYGSRTLDLIVAVMAPSARFLVQYADTFAPGVPIVFCGGDADDIEGLTLPSRMTGLFVRRAFAPTLDVALDLQPNTQQVFVVGGTSGFDRQLQSLARHDLERFKGRVAFTYLTELSVDALLSAVANLPPRSIILGLTMFRDAAGRTFAPHDVLARVAAAAHVPVYVVHDLYVGDGAIGGYVYSIQRHGKAAGEVSLRVLRGTSPADIPVREVVDNHYMFDSRQLNRWGLDSRRLPPGSDIRFREPTAWDRYSGSIIAGATLLTLQAALIAGLLVLRARRRRAESELRASVVRIREMAGRLITAQETERTRLARELHDDVTQQLALLKLDLHLLADMVPGRAEHAAVEAVKSAGDIATTVRNLSRQLYPAKLRVIGLVASLEELIADFSHHRPSITFTHTNVPPALSPDLALPVFRIVQEALQNALKHSEARTISVSVRGYADRLDVTVADDGVGFVVERTKHPGFGLISMRERVESIGGSLTIGSGPHRGTRLTVSVPVTMMMGETVSAV